MASVEVPTDSINCFSEQEKSSSLPRAGGLHKHVAAIKSLFCPVIYKWNSIVDVCVCVRVGNTKAMCMLTPVCRVNM